MFSRVIMQEFSDLISKIEEYLHEDCINIYQHSFALVNEIKIIFCRFATRKVILVIGKGGMYEELEGKEVSHCKICSLSHHNRLIFNKYLEYTVPKAFGRNIATIGLGDRLGLASPAHIRSVAGRKIKPILAQQSKRELKLTGRTYEDVLDAACYAVMQEGYRGAIILTARLNSAQPIAGAGYELDAIAAAVIGGASLAGGQGKILFTLVGAH